MLTGFVPFRCECRCVLLLELYRPMLSIFTFPAEIAQPRMHRSSLFHPFTSYLTGSLLRERYAWPLVRFFVAVQYLTINTFIRSLVINHRNFRS
jgi:hypothetical protein